MIQGLILGVKVLKVRIPLYDSRIDSGSGVNNPNHDSRPDYCSERDKT